MMKGIHKNRQLGFSVVELMIALLLSMALASAIITVFVNNSYSFNQDENIGRMQEDTRHAMREVAFDLSMAGFYADLHVPTSVSYDGDLTIGTDCGPSGEANWMYRATQTGSDMSLSILAIDNATNAEAMAAHSCFTSGELVEGTDIIAIKRVEGAEATVLSANGAYLRTNGTVGVLFSGVAPTSPPVTIAAPGADWAFNPSIYYIRSFANAAGDGIPTLCRKVLRGAGPSMITECLATGIENMQLEYGVDTTGNGQPNVYVTNPTLAQLQSVVAGRIFMVGRTTEIDPRYTNTKTYAVSNAPDLVPNDSFHRRVFSTSVSIQNIRTMNMMGI
jgi:type IV pilus assembly protein PilW